MSHLAAPRLSASDLAHAAALAELERAVDLQPVRRVGRARLRARVLAAHHERLAARRGQRQRLRLRALLRDHLQPQVEVRDDAAVAEVHHRVGRAQ